MGGALPHLLEAQEMGRRETADGSAGRDLVQAGGGQGEPGQGGRQGLKGPGDLVRTLGAPGGLLQLIWATPS